MKKLGIYIHIPFCTKKCNYCDFISFAGKEDLQNSYVQALCSEMTNYKDNSEIIVDSIFIGGGTPSVLDVKDIYYIMETLNKSFKIAEDCEITIESNPKTLNEEKLQAYLSSGINRLSIGLQSTNDNILKKLGRIHTYNDFLKNYYQARKAGFKNINIDLMFSVPGQTQEILEDSIKSIIKIEPEHISFYSLSLEEGTPFYQLYLEGKLKENDDKCDRKMYWNSVKLLQKSGFEHYEISNSAKKGFQSRHNLKYWNMDDYLGIGLGAHSYINGKRFSNTIDLSDYINYNFNDKIAETHENNLEDELSEFMFTGLRKMRGISFNEFQKRFSKSIFQVYGDTILKMKNEKLLEESDGYIYLTHRGIDISNYVMKQFIF